MSQKQLFERKLTQLLTQQSPDWVSQRSHSLVLVVLTWFEVSRWRWQTEPEGTAEKRLQRQIKRNGRWRVIADEFDKWYRLVSVRWPASPNGQFDRYILAYFDHWWGGEGIYTQLQES